MKLNKVKSSLLALAIAALAFPVTAQTISLSGGGNPIICAAGLDSTTIIQNAINAAEAVGGAITLPSVPSGCTISAAFSITAPVTIIGNGVGSNIVGTLGATIDVFDVTVPSAATIRGVFFRNFKVTVVNGRSVFHVDTNASATSEIAELEINNIAMSGSTTLSGDSVWIDNPLTNTNGGTFNATFTNNIVYAPSGKKGYNFSNAGDSLRVWGGLITGPGIGIGLQQISGGGNFVMAGGINISAFGGVVITNAVEPILRDFEIESVGATVNGALISLIPAAGQLVSHPVIGPGQIQNIGTGYISIIAACTTGGPVTNAYIENLLLASSALLAQAVNIGATCTAFETGPSIVSAGVTATYTNTGTGTIHLVTAAGP